MRVLTALALIVALAFPALAGETQIVVYNKGKTLRYDPDVGAELKEVFLETYDCKNGKLAKKETIEAYFHLSDDKEVITPDTICDDCRRKFLIEKKADKYYFGGIRDKAATIEEADKAAPAPAPGEALRTLEPKVKRIAKEVVKIDPNKKGSSTQRARIITAEFTTQLQNFGEQELTDVAGFVTNDASLQPNDKYYVLRSFGYTFFEKKDWSKAIFFYDKCVELIPQNYSARYQKAVAHERAGEKDQAIRAYVKALACSPKPAVAAGLLRFLGNVAATTTLDASKVSALKEKVEAIDGAIKGKETGKASELAKDLEVEVDDWYAGAQAPPPPAPKPPAPEPTPQPMPGEPTPGETPPAPAEPTPPPPPPDGDPLPPSGSGDNPGPGLDSPPPDEPPG